VIIDLLRQANRAARRAWLHARCRASICLRPVYGGLGTIFCFHSVRPPSDLPRLAGYRAICNSKDCLEALLDHVQAMNLEVVSMDAVPGRVRQPGGRRFVAFTFDDGCRDNLEWVCPMFARRGWPD
jgi:peptidoglycan/xylan/chitin deacetylase (PgdA/CDA1 family)